MLARCNHSRCLFLAAYLSRISFYNSCRCSLVPSEICHFEFLGCQSAVGFRNEGCGEESAVHYSIVSMSGVWIHQLFENFEKRNPKYAQLHGRWETTKSQRRTRRHVKKDEDQTDCLCGGDEKGSRLGRTRRSTIGEIEVNGGYSARLCCIDGDHSELVAALWVLRCF